jgi:hypothetical protein
VSRQAEDLPAQVLEAAQGGGGHGEPAPALGGPVEHGPNRRQAGLLAGGPADPLDAAAGLAEGPLDQVGVADPLPVLAGEPQVGDELVEVVLGAGRRGRVERLVLGDQPGSLDVVEDRPGVPLPVCLGVGGDLGDHVPVPMDQVAFMQAGRPRWPISCASFRPGSGWRPARRRCHRRGAPGCLKTARSYPS